MTIKIRKLVEDLDIEKKEIPSYTLYCDMDGVLTNFEGRFEHYSGLSSKEYQSRYGEAAFWYLIDVKVGLVFWSEMEWMPQGRLLWSFIAPYRPALLTSPSRDNTSRLGKNLWVRNNLTPAPKIIFAYSDDKYQYANSNSILIDDRGKNLEKWIKAGGIGIKCTKGNSEAVIEKLKELGY